MRDEIKRTVKQWHFAGLPIDIISKRLKMPEKKILRLIDDISLWSIFVRDLKITVMAILIVYAILCTFILHHYYFTLNEKIKNLESQNTALSQGYTRQFSKPFLMKGKKK